MNYLQPLMDLQERQRGARGLHSLLAQPYPVAIVEAGQFQVFDAPSLDQPYRQVAQAPAPMPIPEGVRAAFPLDFYDHRPACVVTPDVFGEPAGFAVILHEFAHCYQWQTCEPALRAELGIAQAAQERGDFMWEINYPFPYADTNFGEVYRALLAALPDASGEEVAALRADLRAALTEDDFSYLAWQEWKEGFARRLENQIRAAWNLPLAGSDTRDTLDRTAFYAGGAATIEHLNRQTPGLDRDLVQLYRRILTI